MASPSSSPPPPPPPPLALPQPPPPPSSPPDQNSDHHHDDQLTLTPSNPTSPLQASAAAAAAATSSPPKKAAPLPWTHQESVNLIQAYQEKWYSLKRGQLKASQWEEVAVTVAARCGYDEPSKSATQCRHKIEKLRKRYRAEKLKPNPNSWPLFGFMDRLERGPLPISVRPMAMVEYQNPNSGEDNDEESDSDVNYDYDRKKNKSKSINHIVRGGNHVSNPGLDRKLGGENFRVLRNPILVRKREEAFENEDEDDDDDDEDEDEEDDNDDDEEEGGELAEGLATEIRAFAERFVRMENKKIEMMRDTERFRMEMENKRMEMIIESQQKLVDTIHKAFNSHKKMKMAQ